MDAMETNTPVSVHYTASATNFSFALYRELSTSTEGNLFASTFSIHLLLLLLTIGSKSKTNDELTSVLRLPKNKPPNYEKLKSVIENIEVAEYLTVANGIFTDKAFDLSADYENQAHNYLKSEVRKLDFAGNPSTGETEINKWTKTKTNGKISKLFDSGTIDENTVLVLGSAVHFQNTWKDQFKNTKKAKFCLDATHKVDTQMMKRTGFYNYYNDKQNGFSALEIPYEWGGFELLVVLPKKMDGLKNLEKNFLSDPENFPMLLANLNAKRVNLELPKFKFESDINLKNTMQNLGCNTVFTSEADLSKISSSGAKNLKVDNMIHKTFVELNQNGTEAAGVTASNIATYSGTFVQPNDEVVDFIACHPFLFFIKKDNDIIFMGRLTNPNA